MLNYFRTLAHGARNTKVRIPLEILCVWSKPETRLAVKTYFDLIWCN